ncbi:uncharacterized protein LOC134233089 isoform X1 [Saccostrea cucullata]|uniref:uncharacterized protein LOC134233089 isoform X1 n=1 Tax=Saccostrea cuccullata TaxID=36930 RepID=UPI002ED60292
MNLQMYIIFSLTFFYHIGAVKGGCNPDHENNCCQGFFFEKISNECKECHPGYIGVNCSMACRYPGYGKYCQEQCNCSQELCDISTGCLGHNLKSPKTANELQENKSSESRKGNEDWKTASHGQLTPILIGIIAFLTFLLFAIGGRMIWKKVQQSNPKIVQRTLEIQSLDRKLNKTKENEEAKENFYEDIDGLKAGESSKDILSSENDYIDKLDFVEKEKSDNRESNHFYDALK